MAMKLKLDAEGHVVVEDGKPVYIGEDGKEIAHDAAYTIATIARLNGENKTQRERAEEAEGKLKAFEGIEDPEVAIKALETVASLDSGALVAAGKVKEIQDAAKRAAEEQVAAAIKQANAQLKEVTDERDSIRSELHGEKIGGNFKGSKFIAEKVAVPRDLIEDKFGKNFKYEDKRVVGYGADGQKIYSRSKPGELADFDEALETMIDQYPYKEQILKGTGNSGSDTKHSEGGQRTQIKGDLGGTHKDRVDAIKSRWPELGKQA